jgi:hypothetical protein
MRIIACAILVVGGLSNAAIAQTKQEPPAVPVGAVGAEKKPVTKSLDFSSAPMCWGALPPRPMHAQPKPSHL